MFCWVANRSLSGRSLGRGRFSRTVDSSTLIFEQILRHSHDNFYFNNPVDYMANQNDSWFLHQYESCDIHLATGCGPWENSGPTYRMSEVLKSRRIPHHLDDWGPKGGHEWPYWHHQMWEYVGAHF
jgi:esterase/lipase superfamily enzyme